MARGERLALGEISAPEHRVLRATNFHSRATNAEVVRFFRGYGMIDWKRSINAKSGKPKVAYILLSTLEGVVRAIKELNLKELLGRHVRIMRAKGGFTNLPQDTTPGFRHSHISPTPRELMPPAAPLITCCRFQTGPKHRVLLISKLHPDANRNAVELFFQGFRIVDYKRKYNDRTAKYNSTAFVLFESVEERDRARLMMDGRKILGREVSLDVAYRGVRVGDNGFVPDNLCEVASPPRLPLAHEADGSEKGYSSDLAMNLSNDPQPGGDLSIHHTHNWAQAHTSTENFEELNLNMPTNFVCNATPATQPSYHNQPSWHGHGVGNKQPLFPRDIWGEKHSPVGNQMAYRGGLGLWNLAGNNSEDKSYNMITEKEWYDFQ